MHRIPPIAAAAFAALLTCSGAMAMGFARTVTQSTLGQPLNFVATIALEPDETLSRDCLSAEVIAGDARVPPPNVHVSIGAVRDAGQREVRVSTASPIDEPVVTVELSIGCTSRMARRFVVFIDPPSLQLAQTPAVDSADLDAPRVATQTAALADLARHSDASRRAASGADGAPDAPRSRHAAARAVQAPRLAAGGTPAATSGSRTHVASGKRRGSHLAAASSRGGSHLQLDAPRLLAAGAPPVPSPGSTAAAEALAASAAAAKNGSIVLPPIERATTALVVPPGTPASASSPEHDRMVLLEAGLASLREDSAATKKAMGVLQSKLRDAEDARYANGLVYALAGISFFLGLLVAALLWIRPRQRRQARWFDAAAERHARATRSAERQEAVDPGPTIKLNPGRAPAPDLDRIDIVADFAPSTTAFSPPTQPAGIGGLEVTTVLGPQFARAMLPPSANAGADELAKRSGDLSMEELIDLEQQAEFFVVLGQDEAAMSLLDNYMRSDGGKSPLPYLQLLEIHQRRADQSAYESVRHAFNLRFKANAPEWSSDLHFGRALVDYPQTIARLQSLWATPLSAMQALDALLFRRHAVDDTFDFPAYRELLFLYSIARELSGQVETDFGSIDLFLPLEDAAFVAPSPALASNTMSGSLELAIDLDVSS